MLGAIALGLVIRSWGLGDVSFDLDEASSAFYVSSAEHFAANIPAEIHPPLWYAFLFVWSRVVGDGDVALRASSVLGGVLWLPALALLARRLFDRRTAMIALGLAAIWPLGVAQAQLLREYAWIPLFATLATLATVAAMERGGRWPVVWGLALTLVGAVNYQGLALAAGLVAGALWSGAPRRRVLIACAVASVASIPTLLSVVHFLGLYAPRGSAGLGPGSVIQAWSGLVVGSLPHVDAAALAIVATMGAIVAAIGGGRLGPWWRIFACAFLFAGVVPTALAQTAVNYPLGPNYFTVLMPFTVLLIARAVATARRPAIRVVAAVPVAAALAGLVLLFAVERRYPDDFRGLAALVERETTNEAVIVVAPPYFAVPIERYYRGPLPVRATEVAVLGAPLSADTVWLIVNPPSVAAVPAGAVEVATGWWMHLYRVGAARADLLRP